MDAARDKCAWVTERCASSGADSWVDWRRFHHCTMASHPRLSLVLLSLVVLLAFFILGETAEEYFCPQVRELARRWRLSPAAAGVTLLALGNGAPDVFASLAAFSDAADDHPGDILGVGEMGTGVIVAVVSAGLFVSGFVVGVVAVVAGPFRVQPAPFLFDAAAYLVGLIALFAVVRDGRVVRWEAAALLAYYVAFVAATLGADARGRKARKADGEPDADVESAARDETEEETEMDERDRSAESSSETEKSDGDGDKSDGDASVRTRRPSRRGTRFAVLFARGGVARVSRSRRDTPRAIVGGSRSRPRFFSRLWRCVAAPPFRARTRVGGIDFTRRQTPR